MKNKILRFFALAIFVNIIFTSSALAATLGTSGNRFTIDGQEVFLVFASYFDALDAQNISADLDYLQQNGVNGIRIFPNWWGPGIGGDYVDNTLLDSSGNIRSASMARLQQILSEANNRGMIVDISFARETVDGLSMSNYKDGIEDAVRAIYQSGFRNFLIDIQNERNGGITAMSETDIIDVRARLNIINPSIIISASEANEQSASGHISFVQRTGLEIFNLHESRNQNWPSNVYATTQTLVNNGSRPVYLGEPERYPDASQAELTTALTDTIRAGGAAWTFHNEGSFDLAGRTLQNSLATPERNFVSQISEIVSNTVWGEGGSDAPPNPEEPSVPTALYCSQWSSSQARPACGCYIGTGTGRGTQWQVVRGAMDAVLAADPSWNDSTDITGFKDAVVAYLNSHGEVAARGNNGNCNQSANNLAIQTTEANGILMGEMYEIARDGAGCNDEIPATVGNATPCRPLDAYIGSWDFVGLGNRPVACTTACTSTTVPPIDPPTGPPTITGFEPETAVPGTQVVVRGTNLTTTIQLISPDGVTTTVSGVVNRARTEVSFTVPASLEPGQYSIGITGPAGSVISNRRLTITGGLALADPFTLPVPVTQMNFGQLLQLIINYSFYILGIAIFVMIFWAGFEWFTAAGNLGNISKAKQRITNAIIGALLLVGAYVILYTINPDLIGGTFELSGITTGPGTGATGNLPEGASCQNHQSLATAYGTLYPQPTGTQYGGAPELDTLVNCLLQDSNVSSLTDRDQLYSYERTNTACNYTRGNAVCGACAHATNSCHYGGSNGANGSLAIDFNATNSSPSGEQQLYNAIRARAAACNINNPDQRIRFETSHTHVSTNSCSGN